MERLLDLLQEFYGENRKFSNDDGLLTMSNGIENLSGAYAQTYIISLNGGFIKWLVDNDKIDRDKVKEEYQYMEYEPFDYMEYFFKKDGWLIMLLSISDTPIEELISYLK